jgi:hypothetical protein
MATALVPFARAIRPIAIELVVLFGLSLLS